MGINGDFLKIMQAIYNNTEICARVNGYESDWFDVTCGLKQGCLLSPMLFSLYINDLAKEINFLNKDVLSILSGLDSASLNLITTS